MGKFFWLVIGVFISISLQAQRHISPDVIVAEVNKIRKKGCNCGGKRIKPVGPIRWNSTLFKSAKSHAAEMDRYDFFSHKSRRGKDIGQRIDDYGYRWQYAGENIAEGQTSLRQVLYDWIESPSHCKMLMDGRMADMAIARVGKYWVQHFGKKMPPKTRRTSKTVR